MIRPLVFRGLAVSVFVICLSCAAPEPAQDLAIRQLRIGAVLDLTGALAEHGVDAELGARLAIEHINRAGGVLGQPVAFFVADGATDPTVAVEVAGRLKKSHEIDVLVGAMGSEATLRVAEALSVSSKLPTISPSATAPQLSTLEDDGYLFRAVLSDAAQGPVLADLAHQEGFSKMGVIYRDDAYGQGLLKSFEAHFSGSLQPVAIDPNQDSYLEELRQAKVGDTEALLVLTFPVEASVFLQEAIEHQFFDHFLFGDGARSIELIEAVGADALEGMKGTVPAMRNAGDVESTRSFLSNFQSQFGRTPKASPSLGTYDAVICFALATEKAGTLDGPAIRDELPQVCGGSGEKFIADADSVAAALARIRQQEAVNYDGAASTMDWDARGDITRGQITIWEYQGGGIASVDQVTFPL